MVRLRALDLIGRNFVKLYINFDKTYPYMMIEQRAMTGDNLLSQLGGMLSLWLGITIMTAVEFIELLYAIVRRWLQRREVRGAAKDESPKGVDAQNALSTRL